MALSRLAVSGGANGGPLILLFCLVLLFFLLDVLLFSFFDRSVAALF
jgi:hypothetical protein